MARLRAWIESVDRYVSMAGRNCCAGRSWTGLDRSLSRHGVLDADAEQQPDRVGDCTESPDEPRRPATVL